MAAVWVMKTMYLFGQRIEAPVALPETGGDLGQGEVITYDKELVQSDVSAGQSRLLVPGEFLTKGERNTLKALSKEQENQPSTNLSLSLSMASENKKNKNQKKMPGMEVEVRDEAGRSFRMKLSYWVSVDKFVLNKGWNECVKKNELGIGDVIRLTCYGRRIRRDDDDDDGKKNKYKNSIINNNSSTVLCLGLQIRTRRACN